MMIAISLGIAFLVPPLFLLVLRRLNLYRTGKYYINFLTLIWGLVAYYFAAQINPAMVNAGWVTWDQVVRITAPIVEELLKALILIYLVQRADFNYVVDGALYGFGAGIGFAIIENYEYVMGNPEIALTVAVARVFSTNLVHATASGLIGTALAYRRGDSGSRGWLVVLFGYIFSISIHMAFNTMVSAGTFLVFAVIFGAVGFGLIWFVIKRGLNVQKDWMQEKLATGDDRVTRQEVKAIQNIEELRELLIPVGKQFGADKVPMVEKIILNQAEMGIKRKLLESTPNESKRAEIGKIIDALEKEVDVLRNEVGFYCMMFVRSVYLSADVKIWNAINLRVAESSTGQKGGGLWDRASSRVQSSRSEEDEG
ncbi:MAG: PrsW family glutamic-type intramembrane protease [Anaerolineales bacterium]|nr:MAG: PrsW family glutamic-type intramembrane protease [Anaerolineales bacterium]